MLTILCPTDFSPTADKALHYATALASKAKARIILLHITPFLVADPDTFFTPDSVYSVDESKSKLQQLTQKVSGQVPCEAVHKVGDATDSIVDFAKNSQADLVVMGTKGAGGTPDALVGSTVAGVLTKTERPVLVIPANADITPIPKIVYAADLQDLKRSAIDPLLAMARLLGSEIMVLNVAPSSKALPEEKAGEALKLEDLMGDVPSSTHVIVHDDIAEGIEKFIQDQGAGMLAIVARKHGFFQSMFHDSITRRMALHTHIPLLALVE